MTSEITEPKRPKRARKANGTQAGLEFVITGAKRVITYAEPKEIPNTVPCIFGLKLRRITTYPSISAIAQPTLQITEKKRIVMSSEP